MADSTGRWLVDQCPQHLPLTLPMPSLARRYEELVDFIIDVLMHLDRDRYVASISDTADTMM